MFKLLKKIKNYILSNISPDEAFRYKPLAKALKSVVKNEDLVVEIGSGDIGISPYLKNVKIIGLDTKFNNTRFGNLEKIIYDGKQIPFPDNYFNYAISADCLEHVKPSERENFILEMFRVTKNGILLIFPSGSEASKSDQNLLRTFKKYHGYGDSYLEEHRTNGLPEILDVTKYIETATKLKGVNTKIKIKSIMNVKIRDLYIRPKFKGGLIGSIFYFLFSIFIPVASILNFGKCYWKFINIKINN